MAEHLERELAVDPSPRRQWDGVHSRGGVGPSEILAELGAENVVLDTNPDHPSQRRTADEHWKALESVAAAVRG